MSIAIDLQPETEKWLRAEAKRHGKDASTLVAETIEEQRKRVASATSQLPHLNQIESGLLGKINEGLPESTWNLYRELVQKRKSESLTEAERQALLAAGNLIEQAHVKRLEYVAELARLRAIPFKQMMKELGIKPRRV